MLTPEQWDKVGSQAVKIYEELELEIIKEIAERISNFNYANTVVLNDILIAQEMGLLYEDIILLVAKYNETSVTQVKEIFESAGVLSLEKDDKIYKKNGLKPLPLKQSKDMWRYLEATAIKTNLNLGNMMLTTANTSQNQFYNAMNKAYLEVSTGVKSYSEAIIDSIKQISKEGTNILYPSGQKRSVEAAVRMNILTSVNQTCGKLQEMRADEMGCDLMEITAHSGARPEHAEWQGKIVSRSGKNKKYLSLLDIGYGTATGFKGVNCRHDWMPYYEGSVKTYSKKELNKINNEYVIYNGRKISTYEATQIQRKMERQIRNDKKEIIGLETILRSNNKNIDLETVQNNFLLKSNELFQNQNILKEFVTQTNLKRDNIREKIEGINPSISQKIVQGARKIEKNKEMLYNKNIPLQVKLYVENNQEFIPKNTLITNVVEIAGKNTKEFRNAKIYVEKYGGKLNQWYKKAGKIESDKYIFDIHWVQGENGIITEWKISNKKERGS